jgi:hypothetical protein
VAFVAMLANEPGAEGLPLSSADGVAIETYRPAWSARFPRAAEIYRTYEYPISVGCAPPRGCIAKSQSIRYYVSCWPRYIVEVEVISSNIHGDIINHVVLEPTQTAVLLSQHEVLDDLCPLPDREDLPVRRPPSKPGR